MYLHFLRFIAHPENYTQLLNHYRQSLESSKTSKPKTIYEISWLRQLLSNHNQIIILIAVINLGNK